MAHFSILVSSDSYLTGSPVYLKKLLKSRMLLVMFLISLWKIFSSLLVSLQRLALYSWKKWSLLFLFSQIVETNSLLKQKIWKLVIWLLKTIWLLILSACSSRELLSNSGMDFKIQKTCLSSCSEKYFSAISVNLWESEAAIIAKMVPRLGRESLCLNVSSDMKLSIFCLISFLSSGNLFRQ